MVVDQHAAAQQQSPPEFTAGNRQVNAAKNISNVNRGSEFKKSAQQMLNK